MNGSAPVIIRLRRRWAVVWGGIVIAFCLLLAAQIALLAWSGGWRAVASAHWVVGILLVLAAFAVWLVGMARHRPVALRLDADGVSGYFTPPAQWDEIAEVGLILDSKQRRFIGFRLSDPKAFRDRQTPWGRFRFWASGRAHGFHLLLSEWLLDIDDFDALLVTARAFHRNAAG